MAGWIEQSFASLRVPSYWLHWSGLLFAFFALWVGLVARGFLAFDITQSTATLAGLFIAFGVPQLALTVSGGVVADRLSRSAVVAASLALLAAEQWSWGPHVLAGLIESGCWS